MSKWWQNFHFSWVNCLFKSEGLSEVALTEGTGDVEIDGLAWTCLSAIDTLPDLESTDKSLFIAR